MSIYTYVNIYIVCIHIYIYVYIGVFSCSVNCTRSSSAGCIEAADDPEGVAVLRDIKAVVSSLLRWFDEVIR